MECARSIQQLGVEPVRAGGAADSHVPAVNEAEEDSAHMPSDTALLLLLGVRNPRVKQSAGVRRTRKIRTIACVDPISGVSITSARI